METTTEKILGGFRIISYLGQGGTGHVLKVLCETPLDGIAKVGDVVALKVMSDIHDENLSKWRRLQKRTQELVRLNHPNIVRYRGCSRIPGGIHGDSHIVVQELLKGETLKDRLQRHRYGLDMDEGLMIVKAVVDALVFSNEHGIVHRDIKPGNIFLCLDDRGGITGVKLIDFELARQDDISHSSSTGLHGTYAYMAPDFIMEQQSFRGDVLSDVFSMGVVIHEMFTGRLPYQESKDENAQIAWFKRWTNAHKDGTTPLSISSRFSMFLENADGVLEKALAIDRTKRYVDFVALRAALDAIAPRVLRNGRRTYRLQQYIGAGGFGEVIKARDEQNGDAEVAVKCLARNKYLARFKLEGNVLRGLSDDEGRFVRYVDSFEQIDYLNIRSAYLVMQYLPEMPGSSLRDAIKKAEADGGHLPFADVIKAFVRYASGLALMHNYKGKGIIHRDIKPANLYFPAGHPERAAIMDFGIVKDLGERGITTTDDMPPGTYDYMPPEVVTERSHGNPGMDIFALGLCLYEALTGKHAYPRLSKEYSFQDFFARVESKKPPAFDENDRVIKSHPDLLPLLRSMTDIDSGKRLKDAGTVARRLEKLLESLPPDSPLSDPPLPAPTLPAPTPPDSLPPDPPPPGPYPDDIKEHRLFKIVTAVLSVAVAVLVAALIWIIIGPDSTPRPSPPPPPQPPPKPVPSEVGYAVFKIGDGETCIFNGELVENNARKPFTVGKRYECVFERTNEVNGVKKWMPQTVSFSVTTNSNKIVEASEWKPIVNPDEREPLPDPSLPTNFTGVTNHFWNLLKPTPVTNRRERLEMAIPFLEKCERKGIFIGFKNVLRLNPESEVKMRRNLTVGAISNGCTDVVHIVGGTSTNSVKQGGYEVFTFTNGVPEPWFAMRDRWHEPKRLDKKFDGRELLLADSDFALRKVVVSVPELKGDVTCRVDGKDVSQELHEIPGSRLECVYMRNGFKDQMITYTVMRRDSQALPPPGPWTPIAPTPVRNDGVVHFQLADGVRCLFAGREVEPPGGRKLEVGDYECVYENIATNRLGGPMYMPQTNKFEVVENMILSITAPYIWEKTQETKDQEEMDKRERMVAATNEFWMLARKLEPVADRRSRLDDADKILEETTRAGLIDFSEARALSKDLIDIRRWTVGKVLNECNDAVKVRGRTIGPGESKVLVFKDGWSDPLDDGNVVRKGYKLKSALGNLDGHELTLRDSDFAEDRKAPDMGEVYFLLEDGVRCLFADREVEPPGGRKLEVGDYECVYENIATNRLGGPVYNPQTNKFTVVKNTISQIPAPYPYTWKKTRQTMELEERDKRDRMVAATNRFWTLVRALEPVADRRDRLREASLELDKARDMIDYSEMDRLREEVSRRNWWTVGAVSNGCSKAVGVGGREIQPGECQVFVFKDGQLPRPWEAMQTGCDPKPLDRDFDGRILALSDRDFTLSKVVVRIPELPDGVTCRIDGAVASGVVKRLPGSVLEYAYERKWYDYIGKTEYKVADGQAQTLPAPTEGDWKIRPARVDVPSMFGVKCLVDGKEVEGRLMIAPGERINCVYRKDGYKDVAKTYEVKMADYQSLPMPEGSDWILLKTSVRLQVPPGVECWVDGNAVAGVEVMLVPGAHICEYRRGDHVPQRIEFQVKEGDSMPAVPPPGRWEPSDGLKRLNEMEMKVGELRKQEADAKKNINVSREYWEKIVEGCGAAREMLSLVNVVEISNVRRKNAVDNEIGEIKTRTESEIKKLDDLGRNIGKALKLIEDSHIYFDGENWNETLRCFMEAVDLGYALTDDDVGMGDDAFRNGLERIRTIRNRVLEEMRLHKTPSYDLGKLEEEEKDLHKCYNHIDEKVNVRNRLRKVRQNKEDTE